MPAIPLTDLAGSVRDMGAGPPPAFTPRLQKGLTAAAVAGYKQGFVDQKAPDGTPWPKLKYPRPRGGSTVLVNTGRLRAAGQARVAGEEVELSATAPGAATHQFGATIRPKAAKALAIPVTPQAARFASPRRFPGPALVYLPGRHQNPDDRGKLAQITFKGRGKKARVVVTVHYLLRAKVVVLKRPFVGFSADTVTDMANMVAAERAKTLTAGLGGS